jgi:hypothetical protein
MNELKSSYPAWSRSKDLPILSILLIVCLVTYWPLTFHVYSLKNDAIIYFLPVRYQVSQSIFNGYFPLWSPYFTLGHPLHGDMQSGVWNPVVQLFSLFGPYTLYTLQIETLLYIYLCGVGMFFLLRYFSIHPLVNLLCATAYMLCGFNNDSGQFLLWISGSAFLPFVFLFYVRLLRSPGLYETCLFTFFLWLLFSTANPGEFIITVYMLTAMLLIKAARVQKDKRVQFIKKIAGLHGIAILLFVCLALPAIFSFAQFLPLAERGSGATYQAAMSNPLHPLLTIAYVAPMAIYDTTKFTITDGIERNSWFGLFTFIFFVSALFLKTKNKYFTYLKYAFLISFIFSLGELGVLRIIAYYTLPLMNTFRHPAMFKLFSTFFCILLAALYLQELQQRPAIGKKHIMVFRALAIVMAGLGILALLNIHNIYEAIVIFINNPAKGNSISLALKAFKSGLSFYDLLFISLIIQLPFLIFFYRFAIKNFQLRKLVYTGILNCMVHAFIFTFFTVVKKDSAQQIQALINSHTRNDYPFPSLTSSVQQNSEDGMKYFKEIGTLNMYNKKIGRVNDFVTPSNLLVQREFWSNAALRDKVLQYPVIYQPDTACDLKDKAAMHSHTNKKMVFLTDSTYINQINHNTGNKAAFSINHFTPNAFHLTCNAKDSTFLVLCQNRYPFWQASIDGKKTPIITTNISFMGIAIPPGEHTLRFDFRANHIKIGFIISLIATLVLSIYLVWTKRKRGIQSNLNK